MASATGRALAAHFDATFAGIRRDIVAMRDSEAPHRYDHAALDFALHQLAQGFSVLIEAAAAGGDFDDTVQFEPLPARSGLVAQSRVKAGER